MAFRIERSRGKKKPHKRTATFKIRMGWGAVNKPFVYVLCFGVVIVVSIEVDMEATLVEKNQSI